MHALTLLVKAYDASQMGIIRNLLKSDLEGLKASFEISGSTSRGWVQMTLSGEDENTALNYLTREFGVCPERLQSVERFATIRGYVTGSDESGTEVLVDVGVFTPRVVDATVSLSSLQAQLVDGKKVAVKKVEELFGLCENLPLTIKTLNVNLEGERVEARLSEKQLLQYGNWIRSLLDRLIIIGATLHDVKSTVKKAGCNRDVVRIESLGLLEHALVCKLGTDAAGLIPRIGRQLYRAAFSVFSPERILEFLQGNSALVST